MPLWAIRVSMAASAGPRGNYGRDRFSAEARHLGELPERGSGSMCDADHVVAALQGASGTDNPESYPVVVVVAEAVVAEAAVEEGPAPTTLTAETLKL
jgi:hypothetical protein